MNDLLTGEPLKGDRLKQALQTHLTERIASRILALMAQQNISRAALAKQLGKTKGHISQLLNGSRNMTLATLAEICFALGSKPDIALRELETGQQISFLTDEAKKLTTAINTKQVQVTPANSKK